jgi:hypothetical protein
LALFYHHAGEPTCVDGRVTNTINDVGDAAYVVEVTMRYEEAAYFIATLFEVASVGENIIDARGIFLAELEASVENEDVVAHLDSGHVAPDFFDTT